jgi:hypothetical protein
LKTTESGNAEAAVVQKEPATSAAITHNQTMRRISSML